MKIFVGCSLSNNIPIRDYKLSKEILEINLKNNDLIFGASKNGLMGVAYECALKNKRNIIGICPEIYMSDLDSLNCTTKIVTKTIYERTIELIKQADILLFQIVLMT